MKGFRLIFLAVSIVILMGWHFFKPADKQYLENGTWLPAPLTLKSFQFVDETGKSFNNQNLKGHWSLLFFGYSHCPLMCPTTLAQVYQALNILRKNKDSIPQVLFITIDPKRDTPKRLSQYLMKYGKDFKGLTGDEKNMETLSRQLGIAYLKAIKSDEKEYDFNHSGNIVVINPQGQWVGLLNTPHISKTMAMNLMKMMKQ